MSQKLVHFGENTLNYQTTHSVGHTVKWPRQQMKRLVYETPFPTSLHISKNWQFFTLSILNTYSLFVGRSILLLEILTRDWSAHIFSSIFCSFSCQTLRRKPDLLSDEIERANGFLTVKATKIDKSMCKAKNRNRKNRHWCKTTKRDYRH